VKKTGGSCNIFIKLSYNAYNVENILYICTMEAKKFIGQYVKELSNTELLDAVKDKMAWRETGQCIFPRTVADDIYEMYFKPLGYIGASGMFSAMDVIYREVAERVVDGRIENQSR
jgi:hypothetical protein